MGGDLEQEGYRFDGFHLLPKRRLLLRYGKKVAVAGRALSVLIVLVERHGRIVGRDEILDHAFPNVFVEDQNITVHVSALRSLLGPGAITTIPGRGYRFAAALEGDATPSAPQPQPSSQLAVLPGAEVPTNLPARPPLIGRDTELAELEGLLAAHPLVTLTGPGGIGKTSLAVALGQRLAQRFPDGAWLVDLAPLSDPALVATSAATVLGVTLRDGQDPIDTIATVIAHKRLVLMLDNAEYLVAAAAELAQALLASVPGLAVLVTSQERLGLPIETVYRLDPLSVPQAAAAGAETIARFGAVELFATRARAAHRRFRLDEATAAGVAEICRALDGIPLALEMAAARVPLLGIEGVRMRLDDRLKLLSSRERTGEERHRTLRAMLDWSHGLLDPAEQRVFRRLAVFRGSFSLSAVVAVAGDEGMEPWEVIDVLGRLIDKSLAMTEEGEEPRYRLLETIRLFALEALKQNGDDIAVAERHARYYVKRFDRADIDWQEVPDDQWITSYAAELDNVRAAVNWALMDCDRAAMAIAITGRAGRLWYRLGLWKEGQEYMDRAVGLLDGRTSRLDAALLLSIASMMWLHTDIRRALRFGEAAIETLRSVDDPLRLGISLTIIIYDYIAIGRFDDAKAALDEAWSLLEGSSCVKACTSVKMSQARLASRRGDHALARHHYLEARRLIRRDFNPNNWYLISMNLGDVAFQEQDINSAIAYAAEAIHGFRESSEKVLLGCALVNIATYLIFIGAESDARKNATEALPLLVQQSGYWLRAVLELWALLGALGGKSLESAKLAGFVAAAFDRSGEARQATEHAVHCRLLERLTAALAPFEISTLGADGASWTLEAAVEFTRRTLMIS
jgi:predicted ATPase/DNA-binding winged helix-turn-helix (wHTH) protein